MPAILLVRHGQASFGADDYDVLSEAGRRQAEIVADRLAALPDVTTIVHGAMVRQRDTAAPLAARLAIDPVVDGRFDEYDHVELVQRATDDPGTDLTGTDDADPRRRFQAVLERSLARWTAGGHDDYHESYASFRGRVRDAVTELAADVAGTVVVVTSGGVIAAICADALGLDDDAWARLNDVIVNSSVTKLIVGRRGRTLVTVNDHAHLEAHGRDLLTYR